MLAIIGNLLILSALFFGSINVAACCFNKNWRVLDALSNSAILFSFLTLLFAFITCDFSLQNVFINSSSLSPLRYKIAASWSSHEGSMLLFITMLSNIWFFGAKKMLPTGKTAAQLIITAMLLSLWWSASPFSLLSISAPEGAGLNPLLQDEALLYHPPILYLGYACYFVIFCNLIAKEPDIAQLLQFSRLGMMLLTFGIALGSWWAYRELGWGGFWFFDPVENISLIPWLCAIGLHHSLLIWATNDKMSKWVMFLGGIIFPLILGGMFLVRSNLLISVHTFALDATKAVFLGVIGAFAFVVGLCNFSWRSALKTSTTALYSKIGGLQIANILWLAALSSVLSSLIIPIAMRLCCGLEIILEADYFKITLLPILIAINFVASIFAYFTTTKKPLMICLSLILAALLLYFYQLKNILTAAALIGGCFLLVATCLEFARKTNWLRQTLSLQLTAMLLGHFAYAVITISIALNSHLEKEVELIGPKGTVVQMGAFSCTLSDIKYSYGPNYLRQIAALKIDDTLSGQVTFLAPELRWYAIENKLTSKSSIYSYLGYDLYAVLSRIDGVAVHGKIYLRPFISFLWLGALMLGFSFFISLFVTKSKKL
jgi:cytochrome c-type biogenesis protein CcmF